MAVPCNSVSLCVCAYGNEEEGRVPGTVVTGSREWPGVGLLSELGSFGRAASALYS